MPRQVAQKRQGRLRAQLYLGCGITLRFHQQVIIDKAKLPPVTNCPSRPDCGGLYPLAGNSVRDYLCFFPGNSLNVLLSQVDHLLDVLEGQGHLSPAAPVWLFTTINKFIETGKKGFHKFYATAFRLRERFSLEPTNSIGFSRDYRRSLTQAYKRSKRRLINEWQLLPAFGIISKKRLPHIG